MYGLKTRNIRYSVEYERLKPQQICNKSATGSQHFGGFFGPGFFSPCACCQTNAPNDKTKREERTSQRRYGQGTLTRIGLSALRCDSTRDEMSLYVASGRKVEARTHKSSNSKIHPSVQKWSGR
jgi:hypothetical protein